MRRRIGLAQALLSDPQLLLVDEPGASLDAQERSSFCDLLGTVADHRLAIVASDQIGDVKSIAAAIALLKGGRLIWHATPAELVRSVSDQVWSVTVDRDTFVTMRRDYLVSHSERQDGQIKLRIISGRRPFDAVSVEPNLEDAYAFHMASP
jgi:ABC-type multidrug transport system ATPase subunit